MDEIDYDGYMSEENRKLFMENQKLGRCGSCKYFIEMEPPTNLSEEDHKLYVNGGKYSRLDLVMAGDWTGNCYRYPPTQLLNGDEPEQFHPFVEHYEWCGEWVKREEDRVPWIDFR